MRIVYVLLVLTFLGCASYPPPPTAPTQVQQPSVVPQPSPPSPVQPSPVFNYAPGYVLTAVSLSGVVTEQTSSSGQMPIADVTVYCDACGPTGHTWLSTDHNGRYSFHGDLARGGGVWLAPGISTPLIVSKEGFDVVIPSVDYYGQLSVMIKGNTEFDVQLVRRRAIPSTIRE